MIPRRVYSRRDAAFTMVEVAIAMLILTVVIVPSMKVAMNFSRAFTSQSVSTHHMSRSLAILDRLNRQLVTGNFASLDPPAPDNSNSLTYTQIVDVKDGYPVFGNPIHIDLVPMEETPDNGTDDDGDGLVDEHGIRIWEDLEPYGSAPGDEDTTSVVCANTTRDGLLFTRQGGLLLMDVTFQHLRERGEPPVTFSLRSGVKMRNNE